MLPDPILPTPEDDIARLLSEYNKRLSHLERLENFESNIGARVFNSANISVPNNVFTALTYDSERWDTDGIHSTVLNTDRLTAQTAGKYAIAGHIIWAGNAVGDRRVSLNVNFGGNRIAQQHNLPDGNNFAQSLATVWDLAIGDFITMEVRQSSGGALNIIVGASRSPELVIQKIG